MSVCVPACLGQAQGHFLLTCGKDATGTGKGVLGEEASLEVRSCVTLGWAPSLSEPQSIPSANGESKSSIGLWEKIQVEYTIRAQ